MSAPLDEPEPTAATHPATGLDDVVHQRVRLGILTIAHEARRVEFGFLRTQLELTGGNLSQHLGVLESAGLIEVEKGWSGAVRTRSVKATVSVSYVRQARQCAR